jgi:hypothetical protein
MMAKVRGNGRSVSNYAMGFAACLSKAPIRGDEALEHGDDQTQRVSRDLAALPAKDRCIGDEITVQACRQLQCDLDRLVIRDRAEFQLSRVSLRRVREPDRASPSPAPEIPGVW